MRKFLLAASAVALIAACGGPANANGDRGEHGHRGGGRMLFMADANNDGTVTRQEFDTGRDGLFARLDANSDGNVTQEEGRAGWRAMREEHREERGEQRFQRHDANNDGAISRDEFLSGPNERFAELDANHDGQLSADERPQRPDGEHHEGGRHGGGRGHGGMLGADANNDGAISRAEFTASGASLFQTLDANSDGQVTRQEADAPRSPPPARN